MIGGECTEAGPTVARAAFGAAGNAPSRPTTHTTSADKAKKRPQAEVDDGPQQPTDVVARRAAQRMQRITHRTLGPTPVHPVVGLGVADQRLDGLAQVEQALVIITERLVLATVDDLHARVVGVHAAVGQVDDDLLVGDRQTDLDAEFVGLADLALGDAFDLGGVQGVDFGNSDPPRTDRHEN